MGKVDKVLKGDDWSIRENVLNREVRRKEKQNKTKHKCRETLILELIQAQGNLKVLVENLMGKV